MLNVKFPSNMIFFRYIYVFSYPEFRIIRKYIFNTSKKCPHNQEHTVTELDSRRIRFKNFIIQSSEDNIFPQKNDIDLFNQITSIQRKMLTNCQYFYIIFVNLDFVWVCMQWLSTRKNVRFKCQPLCWLSDKQEKYETMYF